MQNTTTKKNVAVPMTNISDQVITLQIGGVPGEGVTEYILNPGDTIPFQEGYCKPVPAAGEGKFLTPIISRMSARTWEDGVRRPTVVPAADAKAARAAIDKQIAAFKKNPPKAPVAGANAQ